MLAIFLTIVAPGLGHVYYGFKRKAIFLIASFIAGSYFWPLLLFVYPYALYDIWNIAETKPEPIFSKHEAWVVVSISIIVPLSIALLWIAILPPFLKYYRDDVTSPRAVSEEGRQIMNALDKYFDSEGAYPDKLEVIVRGNPVKKRWLTDPWGRPYYYSPNEAKESYILMSYGADGEINTSDDIILNDQ